MYMIMFVLNDQKKTDLVLDGWSKAGVRGVTLMETTGAYRRRMRIPGRYAYTTQNMDENNITLMAIVIEEEIVKNCLKETEEIIGDLNKPDTGVFAYWELTDVKGIRKQFQADN